MTVQAYNYHGEDLLAQDKCGEAIKCLEESKLSELKKNNLELRICKCAFNALYGVKNVYSVCLRLKCVARSQECKLFLFKITTKLSQKQRSMLRQKALEQRASQTSIYFSENLALSY